MGVSWLIFGLLSTSSIMRGSMANVNIEVDWRRNNRAVASVMRLIMVVLL
jgi:hypothetical protein